MRIDDRIAALLSIAIIVTVLVNTGCWDRKEIENRAYVLGVAIDYADSADQKEPDLTRSLQTAGSRKYRLTVELPKLKQAKKGEEAGGSTQQHVLIAAEGESMFAMIRTLNAKLDSALFFEDMQAVLISEAVARDGISGLFDLWFRDPEMRRQAKVIVTSGRAEDIFKSKIPMEEVTSLFLSKLMKSTTKTPTAPSDVDLGRVGNAVAEKRGFLAPKVVTDGQEIKLEGAALFNREQKMVGKLSGLENIGSKILRRTLKQGIIEVPNPVDPTKLVVFELFERNIKVNSHVQGDQVWFTIQATFTGTMAERMSVTGDIFNPDFVAKIEQAVAQEYEKLVYAAYSKQQQLQVDAIPLGQLIQDQHPQYWRTIANRWENEIFPTAPLYVDVKVTIARSAMSR